MQYYINKSIFSTRGDKGTSIRVGQIELFFSYDRLIAVRDFKTGELIMLKNPAGHTTARHLNDINTDKSMRLDEKMFEEKVKLKLKEYGLL